jgi:transcriptional regulator with XRE-family HTH domain
MRSATDIDRQVGGNLLRFRLFRGMSQEMLADPVGVTFQQIQKYEKGINRISVSRLWQFSQVLRISVAEFYDGIKGVPRNDVLKLAPEHVSLLRMFNMLPEPRKIAVMDYVRFLCTLRD